MPAPDEELALAITNVALAGRALEVRAPPAYKLLEKESVCHEKAQNCCLTFLWGPQRLSSKTVITVFTYIGLQFSINGRKFISPSS